MNIFKHEGLAVVKTELQRNKTRILKQYSQAPLQWLGPLDPMAERPVLYLRNPNGGLLQGDLHTVQIDLGPDTQLEIRTQSATRLHPGAIRQETQIYLGQGSTLVWVGHPFIPGAEAAFEQQTRIQISQTARLAYSEIWTAGRLAMGERWQFAQINSQMQILTPEAHPFLWEQIDLHLPHHDLGSPGILGTHSCWGSLYLIGDWGEIGGWPENETQWWLPSPHPQYPGRILRCVGDRAEAIWQLFRSLPCLS